MLESSTDGKRKYALLVIDMQLVAFDGNITPSITGGPQLVDRISNLIEICRTANVPIVFIQTCAHSGQPYAKDVHGWEIHQNLFPKPDDSIVFKVNSSGFDDTNLHEVLFDLGANSLIICGIWSEYCVTATSKSALELGYKVCVASDGHGTVSDNAEEADRIVSSQNEYLQQHNALVVDITGIKGNLTSNQVS